jgi:hypothetical protein
MILEFICANLVNFSNTCDRLPNPKVTVDREVVALSDNSLNETIYLAKGQPYESDYRRETDEQRRRLEVDSRDDRYRRDDDRYDRDNEDCYDNNRREDEYKNGRDYRREYECQREEDRRDSRERRGGIYRLFHW